MSLAVPAMGLNGVPRLRLSVPPDAGPAAPRDSFDQRGDPSRLLRYACNIPVIGGIAETIYGIQEIRHAQTHDAKVNGEVDLTLGIGGTINNLASLPLYAKLVTTMPGHLLSILGPIAGVAGCITAAVDGGRDIYNGVRTHDTSEKMVGATKITSGLLTLAGACMGSLPIMGVAATVLVAAVAYQNRASIESTWEEVKGKISEWVHDAEQVLHPDPAPQPKPRVLTGD